MNEEQSGRILFVDDEKPILQALVRTTRGLNCEVVTANSAQDALLLMDSESFDVVVSDKNMPGMDGNTFLAKVAEAWPETVRIMLTAYTELDDVLNAINAGRIWGYMKKPWDNAELNMTLRQALEYSNLLAERSLLRRTLDQFNVTRKRHFMGFIGRSAAMQNVYQTIEYAAPSSASVFITGPSGAGKELVAEAIHKLSDRKDQAYICLNCAAIPSELMESEIFGHIKGAFSGAITNREGAATQAHNGTLFLDELGEMDIGLQAKLLRFIQTGTFQKVGSNKVEKVNIRFVSATNRDPLKAIADGKLREDLFYRLNVISIPLPPLNQRDHDPEHIAHFFLKRFSELENKSFAGLSADAKKLVNSYTWPGNVRQLENAIHSAVIMSDGPLLTGDAIARQINIATPANVQPIATSVEIPAKETVSPSELVPTEIAPRREETQQITTLRPLAEIERAAIEQAIALCEDNVVQAAKLLEVSPSTLYRKIQHWHKE